MTYDDIIQAPNYKKLLSMGLKDVTGPIQKKNLTIALIKLSSTGNSKDSVKYTVHQNGSVRRGKQIRYITNDWRLVVMFDFYRPLQTVEDYNEAFERIRLNVEGVRKIPEKIRRTESDKIEYFNKFPKTIIIQVFEDGLVYRDARDRMKYSNKSFYSEMYFSAKRSEQYLLDQEKKRSL